MSSMQGYGPSIAISVGLHLLLILAVTVGWQTKTEPVKNHTPRYVQAKLVQLKAASVKPVAQPKPKVTDLTAKRKEQERRDKIKKADQQKKIDLAKKNAAKKKLEQDKLDKAKKEKARQEQARKDQEAKRREQMQLDLDKALAAEEELLEAETQLEMAQSYIALMAQRIQENWSRPPSARRGMQCVLLLHMVPSGQVTDVSVIEGSGNSAFDRSAEQAVRRVDRFDELQGMPSDVFENNFRRIKIRFNPEDLRL